jgi:signal transduction histidine kinase
MRSSLIFKLMGAFLLVIAIGALVIFFLTSQATQNAFTLYTTRSGQVWAQRLAPDLVNYYTHANNWQGVDAFLQSELGTQVVPGGMGSGMGAGQGRGFGAGGQFAGGGMMASGQRLILTDDKGMVIGDTQGNLVGKQISAAELNNGAAISVDNRLVGTLIVTPNDLTNVTTPAGAFLATVNQAILSSAGIAGLIALVLGAVLFIQIIKPLRQLKQAAAAIAAGDLQQRVSIRSRDELGELGSTFNQMAESLASAETQRQHLVADVAHELRTPLAAIQATLEGVQDGVLPLDEEQVSALYSETMLLNRLVGDLKLLSLAEAGQLKLERQETDPGVLIGQVVERAKPQADQKDVRLETNMQPNLPVIWVDSDRITQVLNNLIGNALRYTPADGMITVGASLISSGSSLEISVSDTGLGIDPQDLPHIFDRFYRADKSRTRSSGGSGLGLAIVKQLVEAHGGSVSAESPIFPEKYSQGCGTKITLRLPVHI